MILYDAKTTRRLLPFGPLAAAIDAMLINYRAGKTRAPVRMGVELPADGVLLVMPAADEKFASLKTAAVQMANGARGLPIIHGAVMLMDAATGVHLAVFDGPTLTGRRTAALSLLGAQKLIGQARGTLLIVGAGAQAAAHARAFWSEGTLDKILIASRRPDAALPLIAELRSEGVVVESITDPVPVLPGVQIVITATSSRTPVIPDSVAPNALVIAVGAFTPAMAELPASLVRRSRLYVDTLEGAQAEAGDLLQAGIDWAQVTPLEAIEHGPAADGRPLIFKTVGHSLWDLAAAELAYSRRQDEAP